MDTSTVAEVCPGFAHIYRHHMGMTLSAKHRGRIRKVLNSRLDGALAAMRDDPVYCTA